MYTIEKRGEKRKSRYITKGDTFSIIIVDGP